MTDDTCTQPGWLDAYMEVILAGLVTVVLLVPIAVLAMIAVDWWRDR